MNNDIDSKEKALLNFLDSYTKPLDKKDIDTFLKEHKYINYCEAIIDKNGLVAYAEPSHTRALAKDLGYSESELWKAIPIADSPMVWLLQHSGDVVIYSCGYMYYEDMINQKQLDSLKKLIDNHLVKDERMALM